MLGTFLVVGLAGVSAALLAPVIVGVFVSNPEAIAEGTRFLRISGWGFGFGGALMVIQGAFHGAGRTGYSMTLSVLNRWLLRMPIAILLAWSLNLGARGLWWSFLISDVTAFLIGTVWLQRGRWQQRLVKSKDRKRTAHPVVAPKTGQMAGSQRRPENGEPLPPEITMKQNRVP
jgi:Na+-driven multidrug efflux pump